MAGMGQGMAVFSSQARHQEVVLKCTSSSPFLFLSRIVASSASFQGGLLHSSDCPEVICRPIDLLCQRGLCQESGNLSGINKIKSECIFKPTAAAEKRPTVASDDSQPSVQLSRYLNMWQHDAGQMGFTKWQSHDKGVLRINVT